MLFLSKPLLLHVFYIGLLVVPFSVSAMVFNPDSNLDYTLTGNATFNYDSFTLNKGLVVNYFAPKNSRVEIVSEGDIFISGEIRLSPDSNLSLSSKNGKLTILGTIFTEGLILIGKEDNIEFSPENLENPAGLIVLDNGIIVTSLSWYSIIHHVEPTYDWTSGSSNTTTIINSPVVSTPLPTTIWLFISSLFLLSKVKKPKRPSDYG